MTNETNSPSQNTGAGSRQQEQQTAGGSLDNERQNPGGTNPGQSGSDRVEQGGSYRPQGDRGVQFEADDGPDIDFQTDQQGGAPQQQDSHLSLDEQAARTDQPGERGQGGEQAGYGSGQGGIGSQQEQQSGNRDEQGGRAGSGMGGDTRGGNETNR